MQSTAQCSHYAIDMPSHNIYMAQALRCLALHVGGEGAPPTPLPPGCCPGDLAEILEFLQVTFTSGVTCPTLQRCALSRGRPWPDARLAFEIRSADALPAQAQLHPAITCFWLIAAVNRKASEP